MNWLFCINKFTNFSGLAVETLAFEQKTKFTGVAQDKVLILEKNSTGYYFTYLYQILSVKDLLQNNNLHAINIEMTRQQKYEEIKNLEDYIYSFPRVKYFKERLNRHFRRKYYRISDVEFDAVDSDQIFVSRSVLGTVLNNLHIDHRKAFTKYLASAYPDVIQGRFNYAQVASHLLEYINSAIINPADFLLSAGGVLRTIVPQEIYNQISFSNLSNRERNLPNSISRQISIINEHLPTIVNLSNILPDVENGLEYIKENKFQRIFKNTNLPIEL